MTFIIIIIINIIIIGVFIFTVIRITRNHSLLGVFGSDRSPRSQDIVYVSVRDIMLNKALEES